jgi:hypothetical protein
MPSLGVGDVFLLKEGQKVFFTGYRKQGLDVTLERTERYVVYKTTHDGGGTGHGMHDIYPDGHHVWCEQLDVIKPLRVNFYQSGCFRNMYPDLEIIGTAKKMWVFTPKKGT